jgi:hypothetical protein
LQRRAPNSRADADACIAACRYERACANAEKHGAPAPPPQLKALLREERFTQNVWQGRI